MFVRMFKISFNDFSHFPWFPSSCSFIWNIKEHHKFSNHTLTIIQVNIIKIKVVNLLCKAGDLSRQVDQQQNILLCSCRKQGQCHMIFAASRQSVLRHYVSET